MSLDRLEGKAYGPLPFSISADRVGEFVSATGDEPTRWRSAAPPGYAAAALFLVAPQFLADAREASVIHGEQSFRWGGSLEIGDVLQARGRVTRVRSRGEIYFISFELAAGNRADVVTGSSLFLISASAPPAGGAVEESEPGPLEVGPNMPPRPAHLPQVGEAIEDLPKSASRADLLRYAAATGDWNPVHWDHGAACEAGLPGVVCHGLLLASWICQAATRHSRSRAPLEAASFRFRSPLRPARPASVTGERTNDRELRLTLESPGTVHVTSTVRTSER